MRPIRFSRSCSAQRPHRPTQSKKEPVDSYTEETQKWLNDRFRQTDADGVYVAHQPIYGFRKGHCEDMIMMRYIITYQVMKALGTLQFSSFLDVGGAEGYKAALVRKTFDVSVRSCDLAAEATRRAEQIFGVPGEPVDIANLPYEDNAFDVVLCSETLEHVVDIKAATRELVRIARKAVVITVPKEPPETVERNIREQIPHGHIHALDLHSFDWLKAQGVQVSGRPILSHGPLRPLFKLVAADQSRKARRFAITHLLRNRLLVNLVRSVVGKRAASFLLEKDDVLSMAHPESSTGLLFIVIKDPAAVRTNPVRVSPRAILDFEVPLHYPLAQPAR